MQPAVDRIEEVLFLFNPRAGDKASPNAVLPESIAKRLFVDHIEHYVALTAGPEARKKAEAALPPWVFFKGELVRNLGSARTPAEFLSVLRQSTPPADFPEHGILIDTAALERFLALGPTIDEFRQALVAGRASWHWHLGVRLVKSRADLEQLCAPLSPSKNQLEQYYLLRVLESLIATPDGARMVSDEYLDELMRARAMSHLRPQIPRVVTP